LSERLKRVLKRHEVQWGRRSRAQAVLEEVADPFPGILPGGTASAGPGPHSPSADPPTDRVLEEERKQSWQAGFQEGYRQAQEDLRPIVASLKEAARSLAEEREELIRSAEVAVVRLAYEIAKKIIGYEVQARSDAILYIVREALRRIADRDRIVIRLNPQDARFLRTRPEFRHELLDSFAEAEIREDEDVARGSCLVETSSGLIDASLETQLAEIEAALFGEE
jgi:flagellar assembly protein FliH